MKQMFVKIMILALCMFAFACSSKKKDSSPNSNANTITTANGEVIEKPVFTINRTFDADASAVFKMWIKPKQFVKWMGPNGAKMSFLKSNVKEGGSSHWKMITPDGQTKYGELHYKAIISPNILVYIQNFADEKGNLAKLPLSSSYPDYLVLTANIEQIAPKKTYLQVTWQILGEPTKAEMETFNLMKPMMTTGWNQSFDKLAELLK